MFNKMTFTVVAALVSFSALAVEPSAPPNAPDPRPNPKGLEWVDLSGGTFQMGSETGYISLGPAPLGFRPRPSGHIAARCLRQPVQEAVRRKVE